MKKNQDKDLEFALSWNLYVCLQLYKVGVQTYHQQDWMEVPNLTAISSFCKGGSRSVGKTGS